jgi:ribose transport system substrate-binding protein
MSLKHNRGALVRFAAIAAVAALALAGCTSTASGAGGSSSSGPIAKEDLVLVASVINTTNPYFIANIEGAKALSKKLDIPLEIIDSQGSSQTEISKIQAILAQGKKVVMFVNTVASSDTPTIVDAVKRAGGYVSIWWNKPDNFEPWDAGDNFVAFQKHPGVDSGRCNAQAIGDALGGKGNVIMFPGVQDSTTSQTRVAGFEAEMRENYPGIKILENQPSNWDPQLANQNAKDLIAKYGDQINGVWSADDGMQLGAIQAFDDAGLLDKVKFASDGLYPDTVKLMKEGYGNNAIVGETFHRGYMASAIGLYTAYLAATGEIVPSELPKEKRTSFFDIKCVTPETLDDFLKYDTPTAAADFVDQLVENGPWDTEPATLIGGGGPEVLPKP